MEQYLVSGMSCASCQAKVEKAVSAVPGVKSCAVSLLTNSMGVEGDYKSSDIIKAVENAGYGAKLKDTGENKSSKSSVTEKLQAEEDALKDRETPKLLKRLVWSVVFLLALMYFSMGYMMWSWPLPKFFDGNYVAVGLVEMLLTIVIMIINRKFFISGFKAIYHRGANMDSLIALGSSAAFIYSTVILFLLTRAAADGNTMLIHTYAHEFYFESASMILTLITIGKTLEAYSKGKTTNALKSLMKIAPKTANLIVDGQEKTVSVDDVNVGDIFAVRPGETIPVDGVVIEGVSAVNESELTGESLPVDKQEGSSVSSGTINQSGYLKCRATKVGEDSSLAQIIKLVSDAAATKAPVQKLADKISGIFVPAVMGIAAVTLILWLVTGHSIGVSLSHAITVLVVSCPCALGLATPVSIMVGNGVGAKNGILFKTAESLQETGNVQIAVLDKTGTVTKGEPIVTDVVSAEEILNQGGGEKEKDELVKYAYSLESKSEHPLAKAIVKYAEENKYSSVKTDNFEALPGNGLKSDTKDGKIIGGNYDFISSETGGADEKIKSFSEKLADDGKTPLFFAKDSNLLGIIAVADEIKEDSAAAVGELKNQGIKVVMLTGDNQATAKAVGEKVGVDYVIAGVKPDGKQAVIEKLQKLGKVAMVGDGINDAPALTKADIGIAVGTGSDVAIDAADVVIMKSGLRDVSAAVRLARATYRNIKENLFWALIYNTLLIPFAAGFWVFMSYVTGVESLNVSMSPMLGAAAMSLSSFFVVMNALRLNAVRIRNVSKDKPGRNALKNFSIDILENSGNSGNSAAVSNKEKSVKKEEIEMTETLKIEGMMCGHCDMTVKKALEAVDGVENADVSHETGTAKLTLSKPVATDLLKEAVESKDYKFAGVE